MLFVKIIFRLVDNSNMTMNGEKVNRKLQFIVDFKSSYRAEVSLNPRSVCLSSEDLTSTLKLNNGCRNMLFQGKLLINVKETFICDICLILTTVTMSLLKLML